MARGALAGGRVGAGGGGGGALVVVGTVVEGGLVGTGGGRVRGCEGGLAVTAGATGAEGTGGS